MLPPQKKAEGDGGCCSFQGKVLIAREKKSSKSLHNLDSVQEQRIHLDVEYCFKQEEVFSFQDIMLAV